MRISCFLFCFFSLSFNLNAQQLLVEIEGFDTLGGDIHLGLYNGHEGFGDPDNAFDGKILKISPDQQAIAIFDKIPEGEYALAIFQDLNGNGILDKGTFGIPLEPYGFSNITTVKWKKPTFDQVRFYFSGLPLKISVLLSKWSDQ
ncbi:MAG: DUF2141 domain-containing protein [Bacteroidetes bacterium]|nr:DUF2141 domain-containing protein [Bacteroidota bacterium]